MSEVLSHQLKNFTLNFFLKTSKTKNISHFVLSALLPHCPTALLPYCPTALLPYCPTALLPYCPTALLPSCPPTLLPSYPPALLPSCSLQPACPPDNLPALLLSCPTVLDSYKRSEKVRNSLR